MSVWTEFQTWWSVEIWRLRLQLLSHVLLVCFTPLCRIAWRRGLGVYWCVWDKYEAGAAKNRVWGKYLSCDIYSFSLFLFSLFSLLYSLFHLVLCCACD